MGDIWIRPQGPGPLDWSQAVVACADGKVRRFDPSRDGYDEVLGFLGYGPDAVRVTMQAPEEVPAGRPRMPASFFAGCILGVLLSAAGALWADLYLGDTGAALLLLLAGVLLLAALIARGLT